MRGRRLRVPRANRSHLIVPPLSEAAALARDNRRAVDALTLCWPVDAVHVLRQQARADLADAAAAYAEHLHQPLPAPGTGLIVMTGHQPTLYHPGVWFKNRVCHALAAEVGGSGWNVVVDNDVPKSLVFRVPGGTPSRPEVAQVALDHPATLLPFEALAITDVDQVRAFGDGVVAAMSAWPVQPLAAGGWRDGLARLRPGHTLADAVTLARRHVEQAWGTALCEAPVSALADGDAFQQFVAGLVMRARDLGHAYNGALAEYRAQHRIRSDRNPLPDLHVDADRCELPLWVWQAGRNRARLYLTQSGGVSQLLADTTPIARWRGLSVEAVLDGLRQAARHGYRIRPRALMLTLFCRLFVADLFIHGIGGAAYDALTDRIAETFLGVRLPRFLTVSATLHMPVKPFPVAPPDVAGARMRIRDLAYNPDRHLDAPSLHDPEVNAQVEQKQALIRQGKNGPVGGPERFARFRAISESLQPWVADRVRDAHGELDRLARLLRYNEVLQDREYTFWAYPETALREFYGAAVRDELSPDAPAGHQADPPEG